jgi:hypothetical protein
MTIRGHRFKHSVPSITYDFRLLAGLATQTRKATAAAFILSTTAS